METKKFKSLSVAALVISILPLATFIPALFNITLEGTVQMVWAGVNIVCVLLGFLLSIICVRDKESRSAVNIISTSISALWLLMMIGIVVLARFLNFIQ